MFKLITFLAVLLTINAQSGKLRVHVFYESLCPDSMNFVSRHLVPQIDAFNDVIEVVLVPFGKSKHLGGGSFTCQHGSAECKLNRIMSCALTQINDQQAAVKYVGCQMVWGADRSGRQCVDEHGLDWAAVEQCYATEVGAELQIGAENEQKRILPNGYPSFVPTIVYNEQYDKGLQDASLKNFAGVMCSLLGPGVGPCV
ncbi:GILT-like protein 1 [Culicoides brevitarsis]|uniref:GILT-like protein 1 n=1 Tax=Culicoides brevitarsis TaxID=469753 RepID=UPI00307C5542